MHCTVFLDTTMCIVCLLIIVILKIGGQILVVSQKMETKTDSLSDAFSRK